MSRGTPDLRIANVPGPRTGRVTGIAGMMHIDIADGKHSYRFEYRIADSP